MCNTRSVAVSTRCACALDGTEKHLVTRLIFQFSSFGVEVIMYNHGWRLIWFVCLLCALTSVQSVNIIWGTTRAGAVVPGVGKRRIRCGWLADSSGKSVCSLSFVQADKPWLWSPYVAISKKLHQNLSVTLHSRTWSSPLHFGWESCAALGHYQVFHLMHKTWLIYSLIDTLLD